jgi:lipopolysaccharide/colanic/teichoic acid biosynthesis glycosyltransferase
VTGLWQINGRNDVAYRRRVAYDVIYARRRSLGLNLAILAKTGPAVIRRRGCY